MKVERRKKVERMAEGKDKYTRIGRRKERKEERKMGMQLRKSALSEERKPEEKCSLRTSETFMRDCKPRA